MPDSQPISRRNAGWPAWAGSLLGVGFAPFAPGTFGSAAAALAAWGLLGAGLHGRWVWLALAAAFSVLSLAAAEALLRRVKGLKDPGWFVLDEVAAVFLALALFPPTEALDICVAFLGFRLYDIAKPWPVRVFERLPRGFGILADDLAAAVLAAWTVGVVHAVRMT